MSIKNYLKQVINEETDFSDYEKEQYIKLINILPVGSSEPIPAADIAQVLDYSPKYIYELIAYARWNGVPVLSSDRPYHGGYYLPANQNEIKRCIAKFESRKESTELILATLYKYVDRETSDQNN